MRKYAAFMIAGCFVGCSTGNIMVTVNGEPGAAKKLKQATITTETAKDASLMTKGAEKSVQNELKREGFKLVPKGGQVIMTVTMDSAGYGVESSKTFGPVFTPMGEYSTYNKQIGIEELRLSATENGKPFWQAKISGSGEYLNGDIQPGCVRELLRNHLDENGTQEERCYKPWWP